MKRCLALLSFSLLIIVSCKKIPTDVNNSLTDKVGDMVTNVAPPSNTYIDSFDAVNHDGDTTETMTVLGSQLTNPYLVPNMQQAYANLGITNVSVTVTNKYVRFKPTIDQLSYLDSFMDAKGLELFDAPLDYQILLEGDYYQDPSIPAETPTWQYAVVPTVFTYPTGVQYEVLASIHIPGDNYTAVETEAERLASLQGGGTNSLDGSVDGGANPNSAQDCDPGYHWDAIARACVKDDPQDPLPPPAPDAAVPAGNTTGITVDETQVLAALPASTTPGHTTDWRLAPVRQARVVARRWFKIERVYTDISGHFQFTKRFKHKVRINVKFKNDDAVVRCLRGVRVWNTFSPLNKVIGVYSGNKSNISYNFAKYQDRRAKGNQYWVGGTVHNGIQEYKDFATAQHIGLPPTKLYILITNWASNGVTLMLHKRWSSYLPTETVQAFFDNHPASIVGGLNAVTNVVTRQIDIAIGYQIDAGNSFDTKHSDDVKEDIYHELTHSAHYNALGNTWYTNFVNAEVSAVIAHPFGGQYSPYGNGTGTYSPIIALGESWAYHIGNFMADMRYGANSTSPQYEQPGKPAYTTTTTTGGVTTTVGSHINVLEGFDPNLAADPFHWIPTGLYEDLLDDNTERTPVTDNVNGFYANSIMFNAFNSGITTMQSYRANLLSSNGNNQATFVTALFNQYHY